MKRLIAMILSLTMILSLSACGGGKNDQVELTLPASFFEDEDMSGFDAGAYAEENGFVDAKLNDDGSVSIKMSKDKHKEMVAEMAKTLAKNFSDMIESADMPFIKDVRYSDSFDSVSLVVDKDIYDTYGFVAMFIPLTIYMQTSMYQILAGEETRCVISFVDAATNETIESVTYPDALENAE